MTEAEVFFKLVLYYLNICSQNLSRYLGKAFQLKTKGKNSNLSLKNKQYFMTFNLIYFLQQDEDVDPVIFWQNSGDFTDYEPSTESSNESTQVFEEISKQALSADSSSSKVQFAKMKCN